MEDGDSSETTAAGGMQVESVLCVCVYGCHGG